MKVLYEKFLENCTDPIASVRQGGACSLGYLVKANKEFLDPTIKEGINCWYTDTGIESMAYPL